MKLDYFKNELSNYLEQGMGGCSMILADADAEMRELISRKRQRGYTAKEIAELLLVPNYYWAKYTFTKPFTKGIFTDEMFCCAPNEQRAIEDIRFLIEPNVIIDVNSGTISKEVFEEGIKKLR